MQKRRYQSGYYFQSKTESVKSAMVTEKISPTVSKEVMMPQREIKELMPVKMLLAEPKQTVCDTVYQANGVRMIVKVTKVYKTKTYYILCDSDNEAEFEIETAKLKAVKYANGKTDSLKQLPEDPFDYYRNSPPGYTQQATPQKRSDLERVRKNVNIALGLVLAGILFPYTLIPGFIIAAIARKKLKGQKGYEDAYQKATILTIIGAVFLGLILFILLIAIALLASGLI